MANNNKLYLLSALIAQRVSQASQ